MSQHSGAIIGADFMERISFLESFHSPSKIYPYSNYVTVVSKENVVTLELPLIIGEAIGTGAMAINLDSYGGSAFTAIIPAKELFDVVKTLESETEIVFELGTSHFAILSESGVLNIPLIGEKVPRKIADEFEAMRETETEEIDMKHLSDVMSEIGKDIKSQTTSFSYHGAYITHEKSYVTNGMYFSVLDKGVPEFKAPVYMPYYVIKLLKAMPKDMLIARREIYPNESPFLYFSGEGVEFYIQEWMSKDVYPVEGIENLLSHEIETLPQDYLGALARVHTISKIIKVKFNEGLVVDYDNRVRVNVPNVDYEEVLYTKELLPSKADLGKADSIGKIGSMLVIKLGDKTRYIAPIAIGE